NIIYIIDLEEKSLSYCNSQITKILGYPLDEVKAGALRFLTKTLHPADKKNYLEHLRSFLAQPDDSVKETEVQIRARNGQSRWLSCRETVFTRHPSGTVKEIIGVAVDVTDRKHFEENLRQRWEAEKLISTISTYFINLPPARTGHGIEEALELVRQFAAADTCSVLLREAQQLTVRHTAAAGQAPAGSVDDASAVWLAAMFEVQDYLAVTPPEIPSLYRPGLDLLFASPESRQAVLIPMVCNYDLIGVMAVSGTWKDPDWRSKHLSLLRTFSEIIVNGLIQKQSEEALIASENRYRAIVEEHQSMMICRFRPDFTLTYANLTYCRYYGQTSEQAQGASFLANVHPDDRELVQEAISTLSGENPNRTLSHRCQQAGRPLCHLEWTVRAIHDHQGETIEYQAVGRDVTERIQMEEQIRSAQAQLMQSARLASIGQLAASVAHQISNPLTTIIADAQLLGHALDRNHPGHESAQAIIAAGWRAQRVIQLLMKFSQSDDHSLQPVQINDTIEKAILLTGVHLQTAGVDLRLDLAPGLPDMTGNERQLVDLWVNFILMAFSGRTEKQKATTIWINTRRLDSDLINIEICDDGEPITTDPPESIFEPRLIPTGSAGWTGIELSICREIIRQHNGEITARCDTSTNIFSILFPRGPYHEPS
ncbi:MAG TPA: PAS domain S-box protein, partial [Anaerolineaceae bacterium]|nr:PAS domain S-box protein [Anaerolineaceae bacterium]